MNKKRGTAAGFLAALLALSLTACNKPAAPPASSAASTPETTAPSTAATESTTATTTTTTDTQITTTTTKKKPTAKKTKPKTTAPTKATLPSNAPTGSPTPPPTIAPTSAAIPPAEAKAFVNQFNTALNKYVQLTDMHLTMDTSLSIKSAQEGSIVLNDTTMELYMSASDQNKQGSLSVSTSVDGTVTPVIQFYIDGLKGYTNVNGEVISEPLTPDESGDIEGPSLGDTIQESDILNLEASGNTYRFSVRTGEDEIAELESQFNCECQNLISHVVVTFTSDGYVQKMEQVITGDIGIQLDTAVSWYSMDYKTTITFDKPGQPVTVPKPDWVPAT